MKKLLYLFGFVLILSSLTSCVKQENCDNGLIGKFIYYENPQEFIGCGNQGAHNALFIPDGGQADCRIFGSVPKEFQVKDTLYVRVSFNLDPDDIHNMYVHDCRKYKIKCIEKWIVSDL